MVLRFVDNLDEITFPVAGGVTLDLRLEKKYTFSAKGNGKNPIQNKRPYIGLLEDTDMQIQYIVTNGRHRNGPKGGEADKSTFVQKKMLEKIKETGLLNFVIPYGTTQKMIVLARIEEPLALVEAAQQYRDLLEQVYQEMEVENA